MSDCWDNVAPGCVLVSCYVVSGEEGGSLSRRLPPPTAFGLFLVAVTVFRSIGSAGCTVPAYRRAAWAHQVVCCGPAFGPVVGW